MDVTEDASITNNSNSSEFSGSSLIARRAGVVLPKLKNLNTRRLLKDSITADECSSNDPDLDFVYADCDSLPMELSELYCYSEMNEFGINADEFRAYCDARKLHGPWALLSAGKQASVVISLLSDLELSDRTKRLRAARCLLYLLQGSFTDVSEVDGNDEQLSVHCLRQAFVNAHLLVEHAAFEAFGVLLNIELESSALAMLDNDSENVMATSMMGGNEPPVASRKSSSRFGDDDREIGGGAAMRRTRRTSATLSDNIELRVVLSAIYHLLELTRHDVEMVEQLTGRMFTAEEKTRFRANRLTLRSELEQPFCGDQTLFVTLFQMVSSFCAATSNHYPMRKVLLVLWKSLLFYLGGWEELRTNKDRLRVAAGLSACEDTLQTAKNMKAAPAPSVPPLLAAARDQALAMLGGDGPVIRSGARPPLSQRQMAYCGGSDEKADFEPDDENGGGLPDAGEDGEDEVMVDVNEGEGKTAGDNKDVDNIDVDDDDDTMVIKSDEVDDPTSNESNPDTNPPPDPAPSSNETSSSTTTATEKRADSPTPFPFSTRRQQLAAHCGRLTRQPPKAKTLPWTPKIREADVATFLEGERVKFLDFSLPGDSTTLIGLPVPIQRSYRTLQKHVYVSLGDIQMKRDDQYNKYAFSQRESAIELTPAEQLYRSLLPHISQYMIALLKILLAAVPSSKAKTDAFNILCDVVTGEIDSAVLMSLSGSSFSLDTSDASLAVDQCARVATDIHRHKEIIVKSISSTLLLLLKHFRLNHIYQFEHLAQHLVYANCIPLILKFFDHNIQQYVQSRNDMPLANYPACVVYWVKHDRQWPDYTGDLPDFPFKSSSSGTTSTAVVTTVSAAATNNETHGVATHATSRPPAGYFLWRNLFASINLLRVVNKLTKWKHARTMMLVVFKSAPILKRTLRVKHVLLQLYALKLLKMQAKYLGRQWRKSNMEIMSAIYSKVRHRLNDDWAYGNETQSKPWDFHQEEARLRDCVRRFNERRYASVMSADGTQTGTDQPARLSASAASRNALLGITATTGLSSYTVNGQLTSAMVAHAPFTMDPDFQPFDNDLVSVLGQPVVLSDRFKLNYEIWLKREVYNAEIDWGLLIAGGNSSAGAGGGTKVETNEMKEKTTADEKKADAK